MKLTVNLKYVTGDMVVLKTDQNNLFTVGRYLIDRKNVKYELIKGNDEPIWGSEDEIEPLRSSARVFKVKGFL